MSIVVKIKALLAKAASSDHAAEAEAFAAKAAELMDKYQVNADALGDDADEVGRDYAHATKQRSPVWQSYVTAATAKYFGCEYIYDYKGSEGVRVAVVGRESARITTMEMAPYFIGVVNRLARELVAAGEAAHQRATAHRIGMEFAMRLQSLTPKREQARTQAGAKALVVLDRQLALFRELYPKVKIGRASRFSSSASAKAAAASIGINRQATGQRTLALT